MIFTLKSAAFSIWLAAGAGQVAPSAIEPVRPPPPPVETPADLPPLPVVEEAAPVVVDASVPVSEPVADIPFTPAPVIDRSTLNIPTANERCITLMSDFPDSGLQARYQFYAMVMATAEGADSAFMGALAAYGAGDIPPDTPVINIVEDIANPVMRQVAPEVTIAQTAHLIGFANDCGPFIQGQLVSLRAADASLADPQFNRTIGEDGLFLRSILLDSLYRLGADSDAQHGVAVARYQRNIVDMRDDIEFASFDAEMADLEAMAMGDLGERLDVSNAQINDDMFDESTSSAIMLADDMTDAAREQSRARVMRAFLEILYGY